MRSRRPFLAAAAAASLAASFAACGDPSEPRPVADGPLRLRIVAGEERASDTVLTRRTLVVEATDARGRLVPFVGVHATSGHMLLPAGEARAAAGVILFGAATGAPAFTAVQQTARTDARGRARFDILLGNHAGDASVVVSRLVIDETDAIRDTMRVTILPGAPHEVRFATSDTVVTLGSTFALRAAVRDRYMNVLPGTVAFALPTDTLVDAGDGRHRAARTGRVRVVAMHGAWRDTTSVSIVPAGTLTGVLRAAHTGDVMRMVTLATDGTGVRELARVTTTLDTEGRWWTPSWVPAANRIVTATPTAVPRLQSYALDGSVRTLLAGTTRPAAGESDPRWSRDAAWIWFTGWTADGGGELWRVRPDGSDAARVGPPSLARIEIDAEPAPSPDGAQVAFVTTRESFPIPRLAILDLASGERRILGGAIAAGPAWSPDGAWLLYRDMAGSLRIVRPDGTGDRELATGTTSAARSFAWSPDGRWVVGHDGLRLRVVEVATGLRIAIPGTEAMLHVDWGR